MKIGRQDFVYGSAFFLCNDDFHRGMNWDGARIRLKPLCVLSVDLLAVRLVNYTSNKSVQPGLYGFYSTYSGIKDIDWDLFFSTTGTVSTVSMSTCLTALCGSLPAPGLP